MTVARYYLSANTSIINLLDYPSYTPSPAPATPPPTSAYFAGGYSGTTALQSIERIDYSNDTATQSMILSYQKEDIV